MIGDEMRELISAYVDGELKEPEMKRVSELLQKDPTLRREVEAYRSLGSELRSIDLAAAGGGPSPRLRETVLRRAAAWVRSSRPARSVRYAPFAAAAALLLAAGAGLLLGSREAPLFRIARERPSHAVKPLAPYESPRPSGVEEPPLEAPAPPLPAGDGLTVAARIEKALDAFRFERPLPEADAEPGLVYAKETTTRSSDPAVAALSASILAKSAPYEGIALLAPARKAEAGALEALPASSKPALDVPSSPGAVAVTAAKPSLLLLGEILVAGDRSGRVRFAAADSYIDATQIVPMAWGDLVEIPADAGKLGLLEWIAGPAVRKRIAAASGRDEALVAYLQSRFGSKKLADALRETATARKKEIEQLRKTLSADPEVTGFAVFAGGRLLGAEFFGTHELMEQFAARLLPGYFLDAPGAIELKPVVAGSAATLEAGRRLLADLPSSGARLVEGAAGSRDGWPKGLRPVALRTATGAVRAHGIAGPDTILHLTLFD